MNYDTDLESITTIIKNILPVLIPIIIIQWALMVYALVKLFKSESEPRYIPRWVWALIIVFVNIIGPVLYLTIGRNDE